MAPRSTALLISKAEARVRLDPDFRGALAGLLDAPAASAGEYERTAARALNGARLRESLEEFKSSALPTHEVQRLLGLGTPQAVHRLRTRGKLIGRAIGNQTWFPAWQFAGAELREDLPSILEALRRFTEDVVAADRVMRLIRDDLGGQSIDSTLSDPSRSGEAWAALAELAD